MQVVVKQMHYSDHYLVEFVLPEVSGSLKENNTKLQVVVTTVPYTDHSLVVQFVLPQSTGSHKVRATCAVCPSVCYTPLYLKG